MTYTIFLSHAWTKDEKERDVHERLRQLKLHLQFLGWSVWFDENEMKAGYNLDAIMARGISNSKIFFACITKDYIEKIEKSVLLVSGVRDNCEKEWTCAVSSGKTMIPLIMEERVKDSSKWPTGVVCMHLGRSFYIDSTHDDLHCIAHHISSMLLLMGYRLNKKNSNLKHILNKLFTNSPPSTPKSASTNATTLSTNTLKTRVRSVINI